MEWISCKDRLPEEEDNKLKALGEFTKVYNNVMLGYCFWEYEDTPYGSSDNKIYGFIDEDENPLDMVTHWMPLPEPPVISE